MAQSPPPSEDGANKSWLAGVGVGFGVLLFFMTRLGTGAPSFSIMERDAVNFDSALQSGKPTVVEFYANWCEVCKELLPASYELEQKFKGRVNFAMLNVDNPKWAPEMAEYGVQGIPEFVFFDGKGDAKAAAVGKVPRQVLFDNADALARDDVMPWARIVKAGSTSVNARPSSLPGPRQAGPLDHN